MSHAAGVAQASYAAIHVLTERISRGSERVPAKKLRPEDIAGAAVSGGYIVQMNEPDEPDEGSIAASSRFLYVHPKDDNALPEQPAYITGYSTQLAQAEPRNSARWPGSAPRRQPGR